ncbi:MAG: hypothetical protein PHT43_06395, partial [Anaerolineaceae bacterium]|nr:hypothetical protein [Anaerolineaceae bacterium]
IVGDLKLELSQYEEVARFARFGTEVNEATKQQIERGQRLVALLQQGPNRPLKMEYQVVLFYGLMNGFMDEVKPSDITRFSNELLNYIKSHAAQAVDNLRHNRELTEEIKEELNQEFGEFLSIWKKKVS